MDRIRPQRWFLVLAAFWLQGCMAAAALPLGALQGIGAALTVGSDALFALSAFKTVQLTTGGSAEVKFEENPSFSQGTETLKAIRAVAVWPADEGDVILAETLQRSGQQLQVITPGAVQTKLKEKNRPLKTTLMTELEKTELYRQVLADTGADALVVAVATGQSTEGNRWSFERARASTSFTVSLFGRDGLLWRQHGEFRLNIGSSIPNTGELNRVLNTAIAEKILEAMGRKTVAAKEEPK